MAVAGALASVAGGVMGMMQANYQAEVAKMNAEVAKRNAVRASQRAGIEAQEKDVMETRALLGEQEVAQAASGVSIAGKSQVMTRATARILGRRDAINIIDAGKMERHGHLVDAANFKAEAKAAKISGISSMVGGVLGALGSIPSSAMGGAQSSAAGAKFAPRPIPKPVNRAPVMSVPKYSPSLMPRNVVSPLTRRKLGVF